MYTRQPHPRLPTFGFGSGAPPPRDLLILLGVIFATFSLQFLAAPLVALLRLTPAVWRNGFLWQLGSYPFMGVGGPSPWILLELLILFWFGRDVYWRLGRKNFWQLIAWGSISAALVAVAVELLAGELLGITANPFALMQGQRMLLVIFIAAFAVMFGDATIYLFFILPIRAKWFIPVELAFAFIGFLGSRDLAGFLGISAAVGVTWWLFNRRRAGALLHQRKLRLQEWWIRKKLDRLRRKRGFKVVGRDDEPRRGPWVN